jgi:hypothetical protein
LTSPCWSRRPPALGTWFASCAAVVASRSSAAICTPMRGCWFRTSAFGDIQTIESLRGFRFVITNLPYRDQDELGARLVALGARDGCGVALLTRAGWIVARARRNLVHEHPNFAGVLYLTSRPRWSEIAIASPRHNFIWAVWSAAPRPAGVLPWVPFADRNRECRG